MPQKTRPIPIKKLKKINKALRYDPVLEGLFFLNQSKTKKEMAK